MPDAGVTLTEEALPEGVAGLLAGYLGRQRWFARPAGAGGQRPRPAGAGGQRPRPAGAGGQRQGSEDVDPDEVAVQRSARLLSTAGGAHHLWWAVVAHAGARYQVLIGERPGGEPAEFLGGHEASVVGSCGDSYFYDGTLDGELALAFLELISGGEQVAERVRPIGVEQSNTSLVYDDRVILKVFRRLLEGRNPDVEVTTALARAGFDHVATPVTLWQDEGTDLAFGQEFLAGGSEGWALALTSLRDLYNSGAADPAEAGGDFSGEAARLGSMTARMHLAMAESFGVDAGRLAGGGFAAVVDDIERRLARLESEVGKGARGGDAGVLAGLRAVADPGPALRVHGDYHLGQVMRTDAGWYVLDFEGEPARGLEERLTPTSPLKDVAGMLRSFHYASRFALRARADDELERLDPVAQAWEDHNRSAFVDGYLAEDGIAAVLPEPARREQVEAAYELDKALYELDYERSYRPDWVDIPRMAVDRLVGRISDQPPAG